MGSDIVIAVAAGRADIAYRGSGCRVSELEFLPYREDHFVLLAPPNSPLATLSAASFRQCHGRAVHQPCRMVRQCTLICPTMLWPWVDAWMYGCNVSNYRAIIALVVVGGWDWDCAAFGVGA